MWIRWTSGIAVSTALAASLIGAAPAHADEVPFADYSLLADIFPGAGAGDPRHLTAVGSTLFFTANDPDHGRELWVSDGTPEGTRLFADIAPGSHGSNPDELTAVNDRLFFTAAEPDHGRELWTSDGTPAGTRLLADIAPGAEGSAPRAITYGLDPLSKRQTHAYFSADDGVHGRELWHSDGTADGTALVSDINPGAEGSDPAGFAMPPSSDDAETTVFAADDGAHGRELWQATPAGAALQADIRPGPEGSWPTLISGSRVVQRFGTFPLVYLSADDGAHGTEPWVSFTGHGLPTRVVDLRPGAEGSEPQGFDALGEDSVTLVGDDGTHGREMFRLTADWPIDGYTDKAELVADLNPGAAGSTPHHWLAPHEVGRGRLSEMPDNMEFTYRRAYTVATTATGGPALHKLDIEHARWVGSGGWQGISGIEPTAIPGAGTNPGPPALAGTAAVYAASDRDHGRELWFSAGHAVNTGRLADIRSGPVGSDPRDLVTIGRHTFFTADDGPRGRELWALATARPATVSISGLSHPTSTGATTFSLAVAPLVPVSANPTGTIRVWDDGKLVFHRRLPRGERSTAWTTTLSPGPHQLVVTYSGDGDFGAATSAPWIGTAL